MDSRPSWRKHQKKKRKTSHSGTVEQEVKALFEKTFRFTRETDWCMPDPSEIFADSQSFIYDVIKPLQEFKINLNEVKGRLSDKEISAWHRHTNLTHRGNRILLPGWSTQQGYELKTQAWFKFHEILHEFDLIPEGEKFCSVHLCEAPGAFITSLNHYLKQNRQSAKQEWKWLANTLNPYYEGNTRDKAILDDRLMKRTTNRWYFGVDNTGDLMNISNLMGLEAKVCEEYGEVQLVTADGSVNCQDNPAEQESLVHPLHFCEIIAAVSILQRGGSFVLKMFTMFEVTTACLMYLLCCLFEEVWIKKPVTSKSGNSEVYVVCLNFQEIDQKTLNKLRENYGPDPTGTMFPPSSIPHSFWAQLHKASERFKNYQVSTIEENIKLYESPDYYAMEEIKEVQRCCAERFYQNCHPLPTADWICPGEPLRMKNSVAKRKLQGTWQDRQSDKNTSWPEVLQRMGIQYKAKFLDRASTQVYLKPIEVTEELMQDFEFVEGKPLTSITLSVFCSIRYLDDWNLLVNRLQVLSQLEGSSKLTTKSSCSWSDPFDGVPNWPFCKLSTLRNVEGGSEATKEDICDISELSKKLLTMDTLERIISRFPGKADNFVADCCNMTGSFSFLSTWECQSQHLFLAALYIAICICSSGADAIFFFPDILTRFSAGLLFLFRKCFQGVTILHSNHAATYCLPVILHCKGFEASPSVAKVLGRLLLKYLSLSASEDADVLESVPVTDMIDTDFQTELTRFNDSHLNWRITTLIHAELSPESPQESSSGETSSL